MAESGTPEELDDKLKQIEDEDWEEREEIRQRIGLSFKSAIRAGRDLSPEGRRKLKQSLGMWGLTPEDLADCIGVSIAHMWDSFALFMTKAFQGELKAHRAHMAKMVEKQGVKKTPIREFIKEHTSLEDFGKVQVEPWLTNADKAFFLNKIGVPIVKNGIYIHTRDGKVLYAPSRQVSDDQHVTWLEGDTTMSLQTARLYEIPLPSGKKPYMIVGLPLERARQSDSPGTTHIDYLVVRQEDNLAEVLGEFKNLYYQNCLFRNKVTKVDFGTKGLEFNIQDVPCKPVILDNAKQARFDHIRDVILNWDKLSPGERKLGLILHGRTGGGKTSSITRLLQTVAGHCTVFFVNNMPASFLSQIYPWIEKVGPNIIVYEDMDGIQVRRDSPSFEGGDLRFISLLLDVLDGDKEYDVITIATTNHPDRFDDAMVRPGRLGMCIEYAPPDDDLKLQIIEFYLGHYQLKDKFVAEKLLREHFGDRRVVGSHINYTLRHVSVKVKLGYDPMEALALATCEYMSEESLAWKRAGNSERKVGFGNQ